jgi:hypothetical protein
MRNETSDSREQGCGPVPARNDRRPSSATVSIPPRVPTPFGATTLRARLALLRPQPLRLRPASRSDE